MLDWRWIPLVALALIVAGALYIRLRWRRSPRAYRAMIALAVCYFVAGSVTGAWILNLTVANRSSEPAIPSATADSTATSGLAPALNSSYTGPSFPMPELVYDPPHAVLPDPKLTPGDNFPGVTAAD